MASKPLIDIKTLKPGDKVLVHMSKSLARLESIDHAMVASGEYLELEATYWGFQTEDHVTIMVTPPEQCVYKWTVDKFALKELGYTDVSTTPQGLIVGKTSGWWVDARSVLPLTKADRQTARAGCNCDRCSEYSPYAEPNVGDKFVCYQCRQDPLRCKF